LYEYITAPAARRAYAGGRRPRPLINADERR